MKGLAGMKVGVKLILGFLIVAGIAAVIGVIGIRNIGVMKDTEDTMYTHQLSGVADVKEADVDLFTVIRAEKNIILSQTDEQRTQFIQQYNDAIKLLDENLAKAQSLYDTKEEKELFSTTTADIQAWKEASKKVVDTALSEPLNAARESTNLSIGEARQKAAAAADAMEKLTQSAVDQAKSADDNADALYASSLLLMVSLVIGGVLVGILIGIVITRGITKQLGTEPFTMMEIAERISQGDLTIDLETKKGKKPTGAFAALKVMKERLSQMVNTIQDSAQQVASSSEQITASAQKLAEGAQSQASTLEETSASVEELTASVDQVSGHAQSQAAAVEQGSTSMQQVHQSIEEVSKSLTSIADLASKSVENALEGNKAVAQVVEGINLIASSSEKIGGIVTVISDIADQTNLLALNASIEAARAGEHGRGFAVVADEVSKLADRSSVSTKEIENLIKESVKNVTKGVETASASQGAMGEIRAASEKVKDMISGLSASMTQQVGAVKELAQALESVSEMSQSISAATEEQTTNAKQVSGAVENVNEITQGSASAAEEMSAATEQLSQMAQELQQLMAQFKVAGNGNSGGNGSGSSNGHSKGAKKETQRNQSALQVVRA